MDETVVEGRRLAASSRVPVAVRLAGRLGEDVTRYVEGALGWQRVPADGPPMPRLALSDGVVAGVPTIVVVEAPADPDQVRRALLGGAVDVVGWPGERERLPDCAARLPAVATPTATPSLLRVGGTAGGCGTSTVALAVAGMGAWSGRPTVAVGGPGLLELAGIGRWRGPGATELALLPPHEAARELPRVARPAAAVPGLWLLAAATPPPPPTGWPVAVVVADVGVVAPGEADLLVGRADRTLSRAGGSATPVLLAGDGPLSGAEAVRLLGRRPLGRVPWSARVARAGCAGRVPAGLPGSYLQSLRNVLGEVLAWPR